MYAGGQNGVRRIKWCVRIWRRGCRSGARVGWLQAQIGVVDPVPGYVERDLRNFLECGILAHGFARARCEQCGLDFLVAYSCKGRGMCPGCNTRRMMETAAHMVEHYFQQWQYGSGWWYFRSTCATFWTVMQTA